MEETEFSFPPDKKEDVALAREVYENCLKSTSSPEVRKRALNAAFGWMGLAVELVSDEREPGKMRFADESNAEDRIRALQFMRETKANYDLMSDWSEAERADMVFTLMGRTRYLKTGMGRDGKLVEESES